MSGDVGTESIGLPHGILNDSHELFLLQTAAIFALCALSIPTSVVSSAKVAPAPSTFRAINRNKSAFTCDRNLLGHSSISLCSIVVSAVAKAYGLNISLL